MPRVSIGLPVYNGESYLGEALESLLGQSWEDFELILSDNASTDGTESICREYAARDARIRYHRMESNVGAARNFNHVFDLSRGEYFKWAAHDDVCAPDLLRKCVEVLDRDRAIVLCHTLVRIIDEQGNLLEQERPLALEQEGAPRPRERFAELILLPHVCYQIFGLIRADALRRTPLIGAYVTSDRNLLAELSLYGRFHQIPEALTCIRYHPTRSVSRPRHDRSGWFDPALEGKIVYPHWRMIFEYFKSVRRVPLPGNERRACYAHLGRWLWKYGRLLRGDLRIAARRWWGSSKVAG